MAAEPCRCPAYLAADAGQRKSTSAAMPGQAYARAGQQLRNLLVAPDKVWSKRVGGKLEQVRVFTDKDGKPQTLTTETKDKLKANKNNA